MMDDCYHYLQSAIFELEQQKQELLDKVSSSRSGSSHGSLISSSVVRAKARAEAASAAKRAKLQKSRSLAESRYLLRIQEEEMALEQRKKLKQAQLEQ